MRNERGKRDAEGNCTWRAAIGSHLSPRTALLYPGSHACVPNTLSYSLHTRLLAPRACGRGVCEGAKVLVRCNEPPPPGSPPPPPSAPTPRPAAQAVAVGEWGTGTSWRGTEGCLGEGRTDDSTYYTFVRAARGGWGRQPGIAAVAHG